MGRRDPQDYSRAMRDKERMMMDDGEGTPTLNGGGPMDRIERVEYIAVGQHGDTTHPEATRDGAKQDAEFQARYGNFRLPIKGFIKRTTIEVAEEAK